MHGAPYQPDPVPAHAPHLHVASILGLLLPFHCYWIVFACSTCHVAGSCVVTVWSHCVGAVWARSGIAESIIGGKMANVTEDEKWRTHISIKRQTILWLGQMILWKRKMTKKWKHEFARGLYTDKHQPGEAGILILSKLSILHFPFVWTFSHIWLSPQSGTENGGFYTVLPLYGLHCAELIALIVRYMGIGLHNYTASWTFLYLQILRQILCIKIIV